MAIAVLVYFVCDRQLCRPLVALGLESALYISVSLYARLGVCLCRPRPDHLPTLAIIYGKYAGDRFGFICISGDRLYILATPLYRFTDLLWLFARANVVA